MEEMPVIVNQRESFSDLPDYPIVEAEEEFFSVEPQYYFEECNDNDVIHRIRRRDNYSDEIRYQIDYAMNHKIGNDNFLFRILRSFGYEKGTFSLDYIVEKYKYAMMNLSRESIRDLETVIVSFIKKVVDSDSDIKRLIFTGSNSSYTKDDLDKALKLLKESGEFYEGELESFDASDIKNNLYRIGVRDLDIQKVDKNYDVGSKRENVFSYRLNKLFKKYNLPYKIGNDGINITIDVRS